MEEEAESEYSWCKLLKPYGCRYNVGLCHSERFLEERQPRKWKDVRVAIMLLLLIKLIHSTKNTLKISSFET
jgi:hypothetical protein